ncbi:hypothetical protein CRENPOLYSF2_2780009 [Crenothrix polyspora]|uniref:Uncharacterized protein n=1 Tax=Crenothrix polyspora TaxID=360316 RepID=A0A1R4H8U5_9GAMM|nr:hypothetical protein [Crenothrix polyspora]SJM92597.1 hypothetical protein CRENPOLYSF2_2780009 [Crenothrix polyspora]
MSSLHDMKSKYWKNGIDTDLAVIMSDEDTIDRLLVNTDFDSLDLPEITTKPHLFNSSEHLVDIHTVDDFNDSHLILESLVEKTPAVMIEPITFADDKNTITAISSALEVFTPTIDDDNSNKFIIAPLDNSEHNNSVGTAPSLVQNNTKVEKISLNKKYILNNVIVKNPLVPTENTAPQPQCTDADKPIQTLVNLTSTVNDTLHDSEWILFKAEQDNINTQHKKRIAALENSLRKAMLFSLVAALLAGLSLIAVVSGLV